MKKIFYVFAAAALCAACSQNVETPVPANQTADDAIGFSAYTSTAVTRGEVIKTADFESAGIGVFAFYQPAANGTAQDFNTYKFSMPDFMYNQKVTYTDSKWSYSPVKYWPNNTYDQVSFFAYAPYEDNKAWEDMGVKTDVNATKLTMSFPIYAEVTAQKDYLFADPVLNQTKQTVTGNISFPFNHITSQVNLQVGVETDAANSTPGEWKDANTVIEVQSITFKGLSDALNYEYTIATSTGNTTVATTKQDITLTAADNFNGDAATINTTNYPADTEWKDLNNANSVLFLAPEALGDVTIVYTVTTEDSSNGQNSSTITNTITKSLSSLTLEAGKAYNLQFLIGMTSVKITSNITDWTNAGNTPVDVPANTTEP